MPIAIERTPVSFKLYRLLLYGMSFYQFLRSFGASMTRCQPLFPSKLSEPEPCGLSLNAVEKQCIPDYVIPKLKATSTDELSRLRNMDRTTMTCEKGIAGLIVYRP